jgi:hypothetical protein
MRPPFYSLMLSFLVEFILLVLAVVFVKEWPTVWFVLLMLWPVVFLTVRIWGVKSNADVAQLQTWFNIDQTRRNTDKMVK